MQGALAVLEANGRQTMSGSTVMDPTKPISLTCSNAAAHLTRKAPLQHLT